MLRAAAILATGIGKSLVAAPLDAIASPIRTLVGEVRRLLEASRAGERVEGLRRAQGEARFDPTETSALFRLGERDGSLDVADTNGGRVVYDRGRNEALGYPLIRQILRGEIEPLHGLPAYLKRLTRTAGSHGTLLKENFAALSGFAQAMLLVFRSGAVPETFADGLAETLDTVPSDGLPKVAAPPEQTVELAPGRPSRGTRLSGDDDGKEDEDGAFGSRYGTPPPDAAPHAQSGDADGSGGADGGSDGDGSGDADEGTTAGRRDASELTASEPTASDGATQGASGAARQSSGEVPPIELVDGRLPNDAVATVAERAAQFRAWAASLGHRADRFATMNIDAHDSRHAEVVLPPTQAGERILNAIEKEYIEAYADDPDETFDDATFSASAWPTSPLRTQVYERRRVDEDEFVTDLTRNLRALTGATHP